MLGVSGTPVLDAVGKLGDLGDRSSDKCTFSLAYGLMIRSVIDRVDTVRYVLHYDTI